MAQQQINVTGKAGPLIYYIRNGKNCIRTKPIKVKQTIATKKRSSNFSLASTYARISRLNLPEIFAFKDGSRHNRLTGAFSLWLKGSNLAELPAGEMPYLKGFQVNPLKMLSSKWPQQITVVKITDRVQITISPLQPSQMMTIPKETTVIKLIITTIVMPLAQTTATQHVTSSFSLPCNEIFNGVSFHHDLVMMPSSVVMTAFSIVCYDADTGPVKLRTGYTFPAEIIYAHWLGS